VYKRQNLWSDAEPVRITEDVVVWDCVQFGSYPQDSNGKGGFITQPIKWRVLSTDGNEALLLADKNLDSKPYHENNSEVTWETSTLRKWLNGKDSNDFLGQAFTAEEREAIFQKNIENPNHPKYGTLGGNDTEDKIFALSIEEASNPLYGFPENVGDNTENRIAVNTAYAESNVGPVDGIGDTNSWWLRSPGNDTNSAAYVFCYGMVDQYGVKVDSQSYVVRPALYLNLRSDHWKFVGSVRSDDSKEKPTVPQKPGGDKDPQETKPTTEDKPAQSGQNQGQQPAPNPDPSTATGQNGSKATNPATTSKVKKPKKVTLKKAASTKKGTLKLTWKRDKKVTGYQAMVATDKKFKKNKKTATIKKNKTVTKTFTKLKRKKTYYAKVRAYKKVGKKNVYGAYSKVKKAKVK
jgi:hypothetical protein